LERGEGGLPELGDQRRGGVRLPKARANVVDDRLDLRLELVFRRVSRRFRAADRAPVHVEDGKIDAGPDGQRDADVGAELVSDLDKAKPRPSSGLFEVETRARAVDPRRGARYAWARPERGLDQLLLRRQRGRRPRGRIAFEPELRALRETESVEESRDED